MPKLNGFVKIHRKLLRWGWYQNNVVKGVFLHILLTANFEDIPWNGIIIKRGQLVTGTQKMADELGFSRQEVRTAIRKLVSTNEITTKVTNKFTIITVVNWEEYQSNSETSTNKSTNLPTNKQPTDFTQFQTLFSENPENSTNKKTLESLAMAMFELFQKETATNKQPTSNQQLTNKSTTIKEIYKKDKNIIKKEKYKKERSPAEPSFDVLIDSYTENENLRFELKEHLKTRKAKKATLTNHAIELSLRKLDKLAGDDDTKIRIVQASIEHGWTAFFPLRENTSAPGKVKNAPLNNFKQETPDFKSITEKLIEKQMQN